MHTRFTSSQTRTHLGLEVLEQRELPAITILVNYTLDMRANGGSGFFEDHADAKAVMNAVAQEMGQRIDANLSAINPANGNSWNAVMFNPATGNQISLSNLRIAEDTIVLYVGGRAMPGGAAGVGGFGGYGWSGTNGWGNVVENRGWSGFATWGGTIAFDTTEHWHFGLTTAGLDSNELDFYSVAVHELGHVLGIGTADEWFANVQGSTFIGANARTLYGGPVPLNSGAHWADGVTVNGQAVSLDPVMNFGTRVTWSSLDQAALRDIGWQGAGASPPVVPPVSPPVVPPTVPPPPSPPPVSLPPVGSPERLPVLVAGTNGVVQVYARGADGNLAYTGQSFTPFAGFTGAIRTAVEDFNGDNVADYAFATGAGTAAKVRIINGATGTDIVGATQVLGGFTGGSYIAAGDVNRDGRTDLIVSADAGGRPVVAVYAVSGGQLSEVGSFLAFSATSQRGARVAVGDVNRDGADDIIVGAGAGGLPRVAIFDGASVGAGNAELLTPMFLAFGRRMQAGVNVAAGDVNGDGYDDVIVSQGRGGTSRVRVWSGSSLAGGASIAAATSVPAFQQFYANGIYDRNGIRVATRDIDGDGTEEVITSSAGNAGWIRVLSVTAAGVDPLPAVFPFAGQSVVAGVSVNEASDDGFLPPGGPCLCCQPGGQSLLCRRVQG